MKKYLIVFTFFLFIISASAQKKKKQQTAPAPPEKQVFLKPAIQDSKTQGNPEYQMIITQNAATRIIATKIDGHQIEINDLKEFENINCSQLKKIIFTTVVSGQSLDNKILQKIIDEAAQLEVLEIENFAIENFPEIKTPNHHLKKLNLVQNNLKELPSSISNLLALEDFRSSNPLEELPESFSQLKELKELGLNATEFSEFPKVIFGLNKLSVLYISGNDQANDKIKELPDLFEQLPELKEFGVTSSSLSTLPKSLSALKKLEKVSFSNNEFNDFPEVLASNPNLQFVPFTNNPLKWDKFIVSIKKIKWRGLFFLNETGFTKKQYEEIQKILVKIDVYYDGMSD